MEIFGPKTWHKARELGPNSAVSGSRGTSSSNGIRRARPRCLSQVPWLVEGILSTSLRMGPTAPTSWLRSPPKSSRVARGGVEEVAGETIWHALRPVCHSDSTGIIQRL